MSRSTELLVLTCDSTPKCTMTGWLDDRDDGCGRGMDLTGAAKHPRAPLLSPSLLHQQSSRHLSVRFMQHPACQPLNVTPVPSPCASLSLSGMKWKPDASSFAQLGSFNSGCAPQAAGWSSLFYRVFDISASDTIAPSGLVAALTQGLRKEGSQLHVAPCVFSPQQRR